MSQERYKRDISSSPTSSWPEIPHAKPIDPKAIEIQAMYHRRAREKAIQDFAVFDRATLQQNPEWLHWTGQGYDRVPPTGFTIYAHIWAKMERRARRSAEDFAATRNARVAEEDLERLRQTTVLEAPLETIRTDEPALTGAALEAVFAAQVELETPTEEVLRIPA